MKIKNNKTGFTLIEVLVVVSIIGLLSSVILVGLGGFRTRGRDAKRLADLKQTQNALELYFSKCNSYPGGPSSGTGCTTSAVGDWDGLETALKDAGIGVSKIAHDPLPGQAYGYGVKTGVGAGQSYLLGATLENDKDAALTEGSLDSMPAGFSTTGVFPDCVDPKGYCIQF